MQISSTWSGLSRCCFTALRSTARCTEEMETSACCRLLWRRSSCPNWPVGPATQLQLAAENVLSRTMRTVQIGRLCSCIALCVCASVLAEQVWDPMSSSQTARLVGFIHRLMKGYPTVLHGDNQYTQVQSAVLLPVQTSSHAAPEKKKEARVMMESLTSRFLFFSQELLKTIVLRTRRTLDEDIFLPLYPKKYVLQLQSLSSFLSPCDAFMMKSVAFVLSVCWRTRIAAPICSTRGSSGPV